MVLVVGAQSNMDFLFAGGGNFGIFRTDSIDCASPQKMISISFRLSERISGKAEAVKRGALGENRPCEKNRAGAGNDSQHIKTRR